MSLQLNNCKPSLMIQILTNIIFEKEYLNEILRESHTNNAIFATLKS